MTMSYKPFLVYVLDPTPGWSFRVLRYLPLSFLNFINSVSLLFIKYTGKEFQKCIQNLETICPLTIPICFLEFWVFQIFYALHHKFAFLTEHPQQTLSIPTKNIRIRRCPNPGLIEGQG